MTDRGAPPPAGPSPFRFLGVGVELVAPMIVGVFLGYRLDLWLDTKPWLVLVGALLGMAAGFIAFFRSVLPPKNGGPRGKAP